MKSYTYNYFYKITNLINGKYYYGIHSTNNLNDGYMGSGSRLYYVYKKYGIENFKKDILQYFETREELANYEEEMITEEMVKSKDCYNVRLGGDKGGFTGLGLISVRDNEGNRFSVLPDDERYLSGEVVPTWVGKHHKEESRNKTRQTMTPKDSTNNRVWVNKNGIVKYLRKDLLDEYITNGWSLGRVGYKPRKGCMGKEINLGESHSGNCN